MTQAVTVRKPAEVRGAAEAAPLTIAELVEQTKLIQEAMKAVMKNGEHYGVIPGTQKPTLLKPGAEKLVVLFRLDPQYDVIECRESDLLVSYTVRCTLFHSPSGTRVSSGMGQCNSRETKYRYSWVNSVERPTKEEQERLKAEGVGRMRKSYGQWHWQTRIEDENPMDKANTLLKMACKRALIAGVLNATAASDIFTQDLEDLGNVPVAVGQEKLAALEAQLTVAEGINASLWKPEAVLKNASQRFQRPITSYDQLTETEAEQIQAGLKVWVEANAPTNDAEPEPTPEPKPDESESETVQASELEVMDADAGN